MCEVSTAHMNSSASARPTLSCVVHFAPLTVSVWMFLTFCLLQGILLESQNLLLGRDAHSRLACVTYLACKESVKTLLRMQYMELCL